MTQKTSTKKDSDSKRVGFCKLCGYEWGARNSNLPKPPICPSCHSRKGTTWKDELSDEEISRIQNSVKQNKTFEGMTEKEAFGSSSRENISNKTMRKTDDDSKDIVMLNSNGDVERVIPAETIKAILNASDEENKDTRPNKNLKFSQEEERDDEEDTEDPQEVYIPEIGLSVPLIEEPASDDTEKPLSYVAWKTKDGDTEYGAVIDTETAECLSDYLDEREGVMDPIEPNVKDLDVLSEAGLLDNDDTSDYISFKSTNNSDEDEDEEDIFSDDEKTKKSKEVVSKQGGNVGVTPGGLLLFGGICAVVAIPIINIIRKEAKAEEEKNKRKVKTDQSLNAEPNDRHYTSNYLNNIYNANNKAQTINTRTSDGFVALKTIPEGSI